MHWLNLQICIKVKFKNNLKINVISTVVILSYAYLLLYINKELDSDAIEDVCAVEGKNVNARAAAFLIVNRLKFAI